MSQICSMAVRLRGTSRSMPEHTLVWSRAKSAAVQLGPLSELNPIVGKPEPTERSRKIN